MRENARILGGVHAKQVDDMASAVAQLERHFPDFVKAYEPDGLTVDEFDAWPPTARTLRQFVASWHELLIRDERLTDDDEQFVASWHELLVIVGEALIPDPDRAG